MDSTELTAKAETESDDKEAAGDVTAVDSASKQQDLPGMTGEEEKDEEKEEKEVEREEEKEGEEGEERREIAEDAELKGREGEDRKSEVEEGGMDGEEEREVEGEIKHKIEEEVHRDEEEEEKEEEEEGGFENEEGQSAKSDSEKKIEKEEKEEEMEGQVEEEGDKEREEGPMEQREEVGEKTEEEMREEKDGDKGEEGVGRTDEISERVGETDGSDELVSPQEEVGEGDTTATDLLQEKEAVGEEQRTSVEAVEDTSPPTEDSGLWTEGHKGEGEGERPSSGRSGEDEGISGEADVTAQHDDSAAPGPPPVTMATDIAAVSPNDSEDTMKNLTPSELVATTTTEDEKAAEAHAHKLSSPEPTESEWDTSFSASEGVSDGTEGKREGSMEPLLVGEGDGDSMDTSSPGPPPATLKVGGEEEERENEGDGEEGDEGERGEGDGDEGEKEEDKEGEREDGRGEKKEGEGEGEEEEKVATEVLPTSTAPEEMEESGHREEETQLKRQEAREEEEEGEAMEVEEEGDKEAEGEGGSGGGGGEATIGAAEREGKEKEEEEEKDVGRQEVEEQDTQGQVSVSDDQASSKPERVGREDDVPPPEKPPVSEQDTSQSRTMIVGPFPQAPPTPEVTRPPTERAPQVPLPPPRKATPTQQVAPPTPLSSILQTKVPPPRKATPPQQEVSPTSLDSTQQKKSPPLKTPPTQRAVAPTQGIVTHPLIVPQAMTSSGIPSHPPLKSTSKTPDQTPTTVAMDITMATSEAQMAMSYQPVVQVTPHGAIVTLVPTNQLQMASFALQQQQQQQQHEAALNRASARPTAGVVEGGRKKHAPVVQPVHPHVQSVQVMSVPRPETYESTQVCQIQPTNALVAMAEAEADTIQSPKKTSQIKPTHASQIEPIVRASAGSSSAVHVTSTHKGPISVPKTSGSVITQVTAPVAHVPVVRGTGREDAEEEEEDGREGDREVMLQSGIGNGEKLMVQKPEILGAVAITQVQREEFQPKQIKAIQSKTGPEGTKSPQVAVIPPIVDLTKVPDDSDSGKPPHTKDGKSTEPSPGNKPQQVIRRFWTSSWKPLNVNDLERIGTDSGGYMYWYDGGRNMFQSPPNPDPKHKPREADMQLVCKSMVQWMAKLKELRGSKSDHDLKLSQIIKEHFIPRVRVVTQRKPRDPTALLRLIQTSKSQQPQQQTSPQQQAVQQVQLLAQPASSPVVQTPSSQAVVTAAQSTDGAKGQQVIQPTFPQGSILVVPHQHRFQAVPFLPVFANTAVIMPPGVAGGQQGQPSSAAASGGPKDEGVESDKERRKEAGEEKGAVAGKDKGGSEGAPMPSVIQSVSRESPGKKDGKDAAHVAARGKEGKLAKPAAAMVAPAMIVGNQMPFRQALALGLASYVMNVGEPVELGVVDFHSKSVEISGEVPIKAVELKDDKEVTISIAQARELAGEHMKISETEISKQKATAPDKQEAARPKDSIVHHEVLKGHTSTEVMSAKMLLSLTGRPEIQVSPLDKEPPHTLSAMPIPSGEAGVAAGGAVSVTPTSAPSSDQRAPASSRGGRKRKQKPTPSAKPTKDQETEEGKEGEKEEVDKVEKKESPKGRKGRRAKAGSEETPEKNRSSGKTKKGTPRVLKEVKIGHLSPQELLSILNIPPSKDKSPSTKSRSGTSKASKEEQTASARMEQLKAERGSRPVKEFVIESSASESGDESDSSSGSGSTSFSPNSGSSSDSSSDSSSEAQPSEPKPPPQKTPTGRGRGARGRGRGARGGRRGRQASAARGRAKQATQSSSSDESSEEEREEEEHEKEEEMEEEVEKPKKKRQSAGRARRRATGGARGRGRNRGGKAGPAGHIVSIPTDILTTMPAKKKRKRSKESAEKEDSEKSSRQQTTNADYLPESTHLATYYPTGDVDLGTLSELTKSVQETKGKNVSDGEGGRSKRTCVRVREEISRLEEFLGDGQQGTEGKTAKTSRGRGRTGTSKSGEYAPPARKYRRPAYRSQFTQKRRRKRRKPEEEALWQPARKIKTNENLRPVYVFSTHLANSAAEAVLKGRYDSIVQFHNAQPKGPGFIRLPQTKDSGGKKETVSSSKASESEKEGSMRPPKRRSSRLSATEDTPSSKKLRSGGRAKSPVSDDSKQPPTRYSRRIRQQQASSVGSPPSSPASDHSDSGAASPPTSSSKGSRAPRAGRAGGRRSGGRVSPTVNSNRKRDEEVEEEEEEEAMHREREEGEENEEGQADRDIVHKRPDEAVDGQDSSPRDSVPDGSRLPPAQQALQEEDNYTICHGTPRSKAVDMSSPASRGSQPPSKAPEVSSPSGVHTSQQPVHPDAVRLAMAEHQKHAAVSGVGGALSRDPMIGQHMHHEYHKEANNWPAGLGPQFSHVPGGYYGPGLHPMHYSAHPAAQQLAHANYPYGVHYPWGHHAVGQHARVPEASQHHYVSHADSVLHGRSSEVSQSGPTAHSPSHAPAPHAPYPHYLSPSHPVHVSAPSSAESGKDPSALTSEGHESTPAAMMKPASHEKHALSTQQPHHAHSHSALRQLPSPGSAHSALPQVHHAFPRPPHALTPEHMSGSSVAHHPTAAAAAFPYGFDPNNQAALHMHQLWQHTQMQQHPMRPIAPHLPPHLQPSPGMWYPHPLMQGGIAEDPSKRRAAAAPAVSKSMQQVDGGALRMNTNRNNSNSAVAGDSSSARQTSHGTLSFLPKNSPGQFSVEYLTSSQERGNTGSHVHARHVGSFPGRAITTNESSQRVYIAMHETPHSQSLPASAGKQHMSVYRGLPLADQDYAMSHAIQQTRQSANAQDNVHLTSSFPR